MLPFTDPGERILLGIAVLLVVGFLGGAWLNRRRSITIGKWLESGMRSLGGQTTWKWIRGVNSGAQVTVEGASRPFRRVEISYFLLTREFPPLWGIELLRGKRDLLSVRADLRETPSREFEVLPTGGKLQRTLDEAASSGSISWHASRGPAGLSISSRDEAPGSSLERLRPFLDRYGPAIQRLSLRERQPNLMLFLHLPELKDSSSDELLRAIRKIVVD